jgi:hypothetical protein
MGVQKINQINAIIYTIAAVFFPVMAFSFLTFYFRYWIFRIVSSSYKEETA